MKPRRAAALAVVIGAIWLAGCATATTLDGPAKWMILAPPKDGDTAPLSKWRARSVVTYQTKELCEDGIESVREFDRREGLPPNSIYGTTGKYLCVENDDPRLKESSK